MSISQRDPLSIAEAELQAGNARLAVQFAQYATTESPDRVRGWHVLASAALRSGDYTVAVDAYESLSLLVPLGPNARISLATAYGCIGRATLSRDLLLSAADDDLDNEQLLRIAAGFEAVDEPYLAMQVCRRAGKQFPDTGKIHYQMAYYASRCGHPVTVIEALMRRAIDLEPDNVHFRIGLSSLLLRLGRRHAAFEVIDPLIPGQIERVSCECCLKRLANFFFDLDDLKKAKCCAERLRVVVSERSDAKLATMIDKNATHQSGSN